MASGSSAPLYWLHRTHVYTRLSSLSSPPADTGLNGLSAGEMGFFASHHVTQCLVESVPFFPLLLLTPGGRTEVRCLHLLNGMLESYQLRSFFCRQCPLPLTFEGAKTLAFALISHAPPPVYRCLCLLQYICSKTSSSSGRIMDWHCMRHV